MVFAELASILSKYHTLFLTGLRNTLTLTATAFSIGFVLGVIIAVLREFGPRPLRPLLAAYVEIIRGTPMLLQLFIIYYALPSLGIVLPPLLAAILGMGLNSAAYQSEYYRAAIRAIPRGQYEAALSLGMTKWQMISSLVIPVMIRIAFPSMVNEMVYLLKYSSIAYFLTVIELTYAAKIIGSETFAYLEVYTIIAIVYFALSMAIVRICKFIERKTSIPGLGASMVSRGIV